MKTHRISKSTIFPRENPPAQSSNKPLDQFIKYTHEKFTAAYSHQEDIYYISLINDLIIKDNTHNVAQYKDHLLYYDIGDYLHTYYKGSDSIINLPLIFDYYQSSSVIFPNYVALPESKYIYKNIQRKQKIIDLQQQQQVEQEERECLAKKEPQERREIRYRNQHEYNRKGDINTFSDESEVLGSKVFDTKIFDSLLNQTDTSIIQQLFGIQYEENSQTIMNTIVCNNTMEKLPHYQPNKSIDTLLEIINQCEKAPKVDNEYPINCSLKKYTSSMKTKYINCTTTTKDTKDKSNSISNITCKRKVIISNVLSLGKEIKFRPFQDCNTNQFKSVKGLYSDISHNASSSYNINTNSNNKDKEKEKDKDKEKLHISSSTIKTTLISNNNKQEKNKTISKHVKNAFSMPKMAINNNNTIITQPKTTRESKGHNDIIQLLANKIIRMKSITKLISNHHNKDNLSKNHSKPKQLKQTPSKKFVNCQSIASSSSIHQKVNKQKNQHRDLLEKALQSKNMHSNVITSYRSNNNNLYINSSIRNTTNILNISNSNSYGHINSNCLSTSKMTNKINDRLMTINPGKDYNNNSKLIVKTCTHFPMKNLFNNDEKKIRKSQKRLQNNVIFQRRDQDVKGIKINGFEKIINNGRNTSNNNRQEHYSDRTPSRNVNNTTNIKKAFQRVICKKMD